MTVLAEGVRLEPMPDMPHHAGGSVLVVVLVVAFVFAIRHTIRVFSDTKDDWRERRGRGPVALRRVTAMMAVLSVLLASAIVVPTVLASVDHVSQEYSSAMRDMGRTMRSNVASVRRHYRLSLLQTGDVTNGRPIVCGVFDMADDCTPWDGTTDDGSWDAFYAPESDGRTRRGRLVVHDGIAILFDDRTGREVGR